MKEKDEIIKLDKVELIIFDMDGTLYGLDGEGGTTKNSSLIKKVISNSVEFVINREGFGKVDAEKLIEEALKDDVGISNVLSKRYGITRAEFFDIVWNIEAKAIIKNFEKSTKTIQELKRQNKKLFLLTSAPNVWMNNVLKELGLEACFERKFSGEMFGKKNEIFEPLAKEFDPKTILSVGDQFETDLKPAHELGMNIFEVKNPNDLAKLI